MSTSMIRDSLLRKRVVRAVMLLLLCSGGVGAQGIQLSPQQQQMLNQLPAAQRQQAMNAIRQLQTRQSPTELQSINESFPRAEAPAVSAEVDQTLVDLALHAEGRSRLVINFSPLESLSGSEAALLEEDNVLRKLEGSHLFILDESGTLAVPGLEPIPLLGLDEKDINRRLTAVPYLSVFDIDAKILGQTLTGVEALEPFGYDVFESKGSTFAGPASGPVSPDYVLGPGDSVRVQLFGTTNGIYEYEVSRDGILNLPEIGPVTVAGLTFSEFRADVNKRVGEMLIGTQVSVTMGQLRTIRVLVLGDVNEPGSYVVNGMSTISGALYEGGGITRVGSLRNIQLKRGGRVAARLDLYDLLLNGDTSSDVRLRPGDVVFVPPSGNTVSVYGAVKRPAIYETKDNATIADAVQLAGGLSPGAFAEGARIERVDGERKTIAVDLMTAESSQRSVNAGDVLVVPKVLPTLTETVVLSGHVFRPGNYQWRSGMRLTDLIGSTAELRPGVDTGYALIRREKKRGQPIQVMSVNLNAALQSPTSEDNVRLEASDTVHVFDLALGRQRVVEPLLEELRLQATIDAPVREVQISGNVRAPGIYPMGGQMRVSDLIRAGGNLTEAAYSLEAELTRYSSTGSGKREVDVIKVDLSAIRQGVESADIVLVEHDFLMVKRLPDWDSTWTVVLEGEVRFPGKYRVRRGETLADVVARGGGFAEGAFVEGAVFLRETLKEQEQDQIELLARRLEADLATLSLQDASSGGSETLSTGRLLLDQLRETEAVGRLVINLWQVSNGVAGSGWDVEMRDGDKLMVPTYPQVVTVLGEAQQNTSHLYQEGMTRNDYIALSGGLTRRADKKLIYIVRANGAVVANNRSRWFGRKGNVEVRPGDTIVVPLDTDRIRPLTFWGNVTQILYQGAIAVAAVKTFDN